MVVAEAVWQYTHHVLPGLLDREGPILTVSNWSGEWPGLVGMLNLNGSPRQGRQEVQHPLERGLHRPLLREGAQEAGWSSGAVKHDASHVPPVLRQGAPRRRAAKLGARFAQELRARKSIMGIFDEGCMGMYNAIIQDELLFPLGIYKERLSQSALYAQEPHRHRRRGPRPSTSGCSIAA